MDAPAFVCRSLAEFHSKLRLGWDGESQAFGLLQIFHRHDAERSFREEWAHGPVFSKTGRPRKDWDLLSHVPIYLIRLTKKDIGFDPNLEGWGRLLKLVKRWARPIGARIYNKAKEKGQAVEDFVDTMSLDMADRVFRSGQRSGVGAPIVAKKFIKPTINQAKRRVGGLSFEESQMPPPPPRGWEKAKAKDRVGEGDPDDLGAIGGAP